MFRASPAVEIAESTPEAPADALIPLSHLALDLPQPPEGWGAYLGRRSIPFLPDDLGRDSIRRGDAKRLLDEQRAEEIRKAKLQGG